MIYSIKSSRQVKESKTSELLSTHSLDDVVMNRKKTSFSRKMFDVSRLKTIEQVVAGQILKKERRDRYRTIIDEIFLSKYDFYALAT